MANTLPTGQLRMLVQVEPVDVASGTDFAEDTVLYADPSLIADVDGLGAFSWQWQRSTDNGATWSNIGGQTGASYTIGLADIGFRVRVTGSYQDGLGTVETVNSTTSAAVIATNDAPIASDTAVAVDQDTALNAALPAASDEEGDAITYAKVSDPTNGAVIVNANGTYTYTPTAAYAGSDSFTYSVSDANGGINTYTVTVTVNDTLAPTVASFSPVDALVGAPVEKDIVVTFSEDIALGAGLIVLKTAGGAVIQNFNVATSTALTVVGNTLTINPGNNLSGNTEYFVTFVAGSVTDLTGNAYGGTTAYHFTTANVVNGNSLANSLLGTGAIDELFGLAENDTLDGGAGEDILVGGIGNDTYLINSSGDSITELTGEGTDTANASVTYTIASEVENLTLTGVDVISGTGNGLANVLTGNSAGNVLTGLGGADTFNGGGGDDTFVGGLGDDTYFVDSVADVVTEVTGEGIDTIFSTVTYQLLPGSDDLTLTGAANINATGNGGANLITGNDGNNLLAGGGGTDTLVGGLGIDTLKGGTSDDTYQVVDTIDVITELANQGIDTVVSTVNYRIGTNVENLTVTGTDNLTLTGNGYGNVLIGNDGVNLISGLGGADTMDGGLGNDTLNGSIGNDRFVFDTALGAANVDTIVSFSTIDTLELSAAIFTTLSEGVLDVDQFVTGAGALDANDHIIYNSTTGAVSYDADGIGGSAAIQFATFTGGVTGTLSAADFMIIT